jgi:uncharacterized protein (DUF1330 family)
MPAYVIGNVEVHDPQTYEKYRAHTLETIQAFGGRFLVRGGEVEVKEGVWHPRRMVLLEFPDLATARRWYDSAAYQAILPYRIESAKTDLLLVEGLP